MSSVHATTTIMLVDDTPTNLILLGEILHANGYRAVAFPSGDLALKAAAKHPPDLILLDIRMPEMDGFEVCRQLKANPLLASIPVIFISAMDDTEHKLQAFELGGVDYVTKPFQEAEVLARVATHLRIIHLQHRLTAHNENLEQLVAQRTQELAQAHTRLLELDRLKNDFLHMISHEIRTPANGILGIGELLLELCADHEDATGFAEAFRQSSQRLHNLINDATLLAELKQLCTDMGQSSSLAHILDDLKQALRPLTITIHTDADLAALHSQANPVLIQKALKTAVQLAGCFSKAKQTLALELRLEEEMLNIRITLDDLSLNAAQAEEFFQLASAVRSCSRAENMGLAPVVAHNILTALGGGLALCKVADDATQDHLLARIPHCSYLPSP